LADIFSLLNEPNLSLQGKNKSQIEAAEKVPPSKRSYPYGKKVQETRILAWFSLLDNEIGDQEVNVWLVFN